MGPDGLASGRSEYVAALADLAEKVESVHVHIDLDVIDISDGRANEFAVAGGPPLDVLDAAIGTIGDHSPVNSLSLTSYNPTVDDDERALAAGMRLLGALAELATRN